MTKEGKSIAEKAKRGYLWTLLLSAIGQPLSFIFGIILARILSPEDFGLIAGSLIFTEIGSTLVSSGFVSGLVQKRDVSSLDFSSIFVLQVSISLLLAALITLSAPMVANLLDSALMSPVLSALSFNLIILAFCGIPTAIARRDLNFRLLTWAGLTEMVVYGAVAISMAFYGYGVWSLVAGKLIGRLSYTVFLNCATNWRPALQFSRTSARSLLGISSQFACKNILNDVTANIDYFIVGRALGMASLGFYSRAYNLMTLPVTKLSASLGTVLFPAFSKIQDDSRRVHNGLIKSTCLISMTTFPVLICLQLFAPSIITILYGLKWTPTIIPLQIVCIAGLFYTIDSPAVSVINAKGLLSDEIKRQLFHLILLVSCILFGAKWGLAGVAFGVSFSAFFYWILLLQLLRKKLSLPLKDYLAGLMPASLASLMMILVVTGFQKLALRIISVTSIPAFLALAVFSVVSYLAALWGIRRFFHAPVIKDAYREVESFILGIWTRIARFLPSTTRLQNE